MDPNQTGTIQPTQQQPETTPPAPQPSNNKKMIVGIAIGLGALLLVLIVLIAILLSQRASNSGDDEQKEGNSSQVSDDNPSDVDDRKVVKRVTLEKNPSLQVTIYQPRQTGTNTTIDYSVKNICKTSCKDHEYVDSYTLGVIDESSAYLLDAESGTKFNPIMDSNNKPLASEPCAGFISQGKSVECFAAFTKVPDGTTFSFVLRGLKVDGLTAE